MDKLTDAFGLIGLMVVGGMAASRVNIITPASINLNGVTVVFGYFKYIAAIADSIIDNARYPENGK